MRVNKLKVTIIRFSSKLDINLRARITDCWLLASKTNASNDHSWTIVIRWNEMPIVLQCVLDYSVYYHLRVFAASDAGYLSAKLQSCAPSMHCRSFSLLSERDLKLPLDKQVYDYLFLFYFKWLFWFHGTTWKMPWVYIRIVRGINCIFAIFN